MNGALVTLFSNFSLLKKENIWYHFQIFFSSLLDYSKLCLWLLITGTDVIVEGEILKLGGPFLNSWQKRHLRLYPNRLEFYQKNRDGGIQKNKVEVCILKTIFKLLCRYFTALAHPCRLWLIMTEAAAAALE